MAFPRVGEDGEQMTTQEPGPAAHHGFVLLQAAPAEAVLDDVRMADRRADALSDLGLTVDARWITGVLVDASSNSKVRTSTSQQYFDGRGWRERGDAPSDAERI
jgi:hypothetical protein